MIQLRPLTSTRIANGLAALILVLVPFHAFLTTWAASIVGHYTLLRLWDEVLLLALFGIVTTWVIREKPLRGWLSSSLLVRLIAIYAVLTLVLGLIAYSKTEVTAKALGYGVLVNLRFLAFFVAVAVVAKRSNWLASHWGRLLLGPAVLVCLFALLQYTVLPHNFLSHFGYGPTTISPIETINNNTNYIRVESTLRGANPLGAYMVLIAGAVAALWQLRARRQILLGLGLLTLEALVFSFSRSAWLGAIIAVSVALWLQLKPGKTKQIASFAALVGIVILAGAFATLRHNITVENALFHTDQKSTIAVSSNDAHASALSGGLSDVTHQPFGRGPGTAGPASVYNAPHAPRIAENYFVQIAQEVGWAGLLLFLAIIYIVALELYRRAKGSALALALFASLLGITFVNLLSHAWVDDTLAYVWWGMAAVALAADLPKPEAKTIPSKTPKK